MSGLLLCHHYTSPVPTAACLPAGVDSKLSAAYLRHEDDFMMMIS
jgi:hypothetical protein